MLHMQIALIGSSTARKTHCTLMPLQCAPRNLLSVYFQGTMPERININLHGTRNTISRNVFCTKVNTRKDFFPYLNSVYPYAVDTGTESLEELHVHGIQLCWTRKYGLQAKRQARTHKHVPPHLIFLVLPHTADNGIHGDACTDGRHWQRLGTLFQRRGEVCQLHMI